MVKQNPFSIYDFLGYLIPGALCIYIFLFAYQLESYTEISKMEEIIKEYGKFELDKFMFFIIIGYSLGHLINFISSITIERYANWRYNYPSKYLMGFNEDFKFWKGSCIVKLWKVTLMLILLPITIWDLVLGEIFSFKSFYTKKADEYVIRLVKKKGPILISKINSPTVSNLSQLDFHRVFAHYAYEYSRNHQTKMSNYVALYGFLRSLSFITTGLFWGIALIFLLKDIDISTDYKVIIITIISLFPYIYFMAFMKFYRRYSLESLMVVAIDKDLK